VLTGLKMELAVLEKQIPPELESLLVRMRSMTQLIDTSIGTVQRIAADLRPGILDDLGLFAAMEWQSKDFEERTGIECRVSSDPDELNLDPARSTTIFRIFQEALTNVARHAEARQVVAELAEEADRVVLRVQDDGKGISESEISNPASLGLLGMRERARSWGGEVDIQGTQGQGTTVTVWIPCAGEADARG
jgi:signal transduction histidine kinase